MSPHAPHQPLTYQLHPNKTLRSRISILFFPVFSQSSPFSSCDSKSSSPDPLPPSSPLPSSSSSSSSSLFLSFSFFDSSFLAAGAGFVVTKSDFFSNVALDLCVSHPDQALAPCATAEKGEIPAAAAPNPKVYINSVHTRGTLPFSAQHHHSTRPVTV